MWLQIQQSAKQVLGVCEQKGTDKLQLDYDPRNPFDICSLTFTPIYRGNPYTEDPYTKARCAASSKSHSIISACHCFWCFVVVSESTAFSVPKQYCHALQTPERNAALAVADCMT